MKFQIAIACLIGAALAQVGPDDPNKECVSDFGLCNSDADCCNSQCMGQVCGGMKEEKGKCDKQYNVCSNDSCCMGLICYEETACIPENSFILTNPGQVDTNAFKIPQ